MLRYYTRVCNFYYGSKSKSLVRKGKTLPLNGNHKISFDKIEIISRKSTKIISIKEINYLSKQIKKIVKKDLKIITSRRKRFKNLNLENIPNIMGILNVTPDSFSDGGKYNKTNLALKHLKFPE